MMVSRRWPWLAISTLRRRVSVVRRFSFYSQSNLVPDGAEKFQVPRTVSVLIFIMLYN